MTRFERVRARPPQRWARPLAHALARALAAVLAILLPLLLVLPGAVGDTILRTDRAAGAVLEDDDPVVVGAPGCSAVFTFPLGASDTKHFAGPPTSTTTVEYKLTPNFYNVGESEIRVYDVDPELTYKREEYWIGGGHSFITDEEKYAHKKGGTWRIEFDSDPVVVVASGYVQFQVCWS